jgi:O-antigen ligase
MNDTETSRQPQSLLSRVFFLLACLTILIAPTQWSLEIRKGFFISPADITLLLTAAVWGLEIIAGRGWKQIFVHAPPWSHLLFIACIAASAAVAGDKLSAVKELIQYGLYFIVGYMVFDRLLRRFPSAAKTSLLLFALTSGAITLLALAQYLNAEVDDLMVRGSFGNRNVLAGFYALTMPLLFACLIETRSRLMKLLLGILFLTALSVNLSGAAYAAVATATVLIAARNGLKWFVPVTAVLVLWQSQVMPRLPRENDLVHFRSIALYDDTSEVERRYPDWQAAGSMILTRPLLGCGAGNYQKHVGQFYDTIPRRTGPSEPDTQNMHLVIAASAGIPALLAFLAMFVAPFCKENIFPMKHSILIHGAIGSLAAFAFTLAWHPLLVRGIGLPFALLLVFTRFLVQTESVNGN